MTNDKVDERNKIMSHAELITALEELRLLGFLEIRDEDYLFLTDAGAVEVHRLLQDHQPRERVLFMLGCSGLKADTEQ